MTKEEAALLLQKVRQTVLLLDTLPNYPDPTPSVVVVDAKTLQQLRAELLRALADKYRGVI